MKNKVTCGYCKKKIKKNSKKCPHCSKQFNIFKKQEKETTVEEKKKSWFTNNWGAFIGALIGAIYGFIKNVEVWWWVPTSPVPPCTAPPGMVCTPPIQLATCTQFPNKVVIFGKCIAGLTHMNEVRLFIPIFLIIGFLIGWGIHVLIRKLIKK